MSPSPAVATHGRTGLGYQRAADASAIATAPYTVGFYLVPNFAMMAFVSAIEPLRAANRMSGERRFDWRLYSTDGHPVLASNGIEIAVHGSVADDATVDLLLVCAGTRNAEGGDKCLFEWLRRLDGNGASLGAISLGAYVLARAGLLDGRRCAMHWENLAAFADQFPRVRTTTDIFVIDNRRCTCAGGTAALDMMLRIIADRDGRELANDVSEQFIHARIRGTHDQQRMAVQGRFGVANEKLIAAIEMMEDANGEPRPVQEIATAVDLSARQLERLFAKYLHASPSVYHLNLRLDRARALLMQTTMPVLDIAVSCGFASASHFSRCYRALYGHKPSDERAAGPSAPPAAARPRTAGAAR